jgi:SpoVK/Ycf46/Vps4 family AAA+-type ATPase
LDSGRRGINRLIVMIVNDIKSIEPALIRHGRFDKVIHFDYPGVHRCMSLWKHYCRFVPEKIEEEEDEVRAVFEEEVSSKKRLSFGCIAYAARLYYGKYYNSWVEALKESISQRVDLEKYCGVKNSYDEE